MPVRIHHLNCATFCPLGGGLVDGRRGLLEASRLVCHCLLIEGPNGLILVDTGLGTQDLAHPLWRLGPGFLGLIRPKLDPAETALRQIQRLGLRADDVRDIVLTHLDPDHCGGLPDFPHARVHVYGPELEAAQHPRTVFERARYRTAPWKHGPRWVPHATAAAGGDRWLGFQSVRALDDSSPEVLLVPLLGHTRGHAGVAVRTDEKWLLHCGDAYFFHAEMHQPPHCPPGLIAMQRIDDHDHAQRVANQERLRTLARTHAAEVRLFCSHDEHELAQWQ